MTSEGRVFTDDMIARAVDPKNAQSCGGCTACCTALGIKELQKPAGVPCQYIKLGLLDRGSEKIAGCTIYGQRPQSCQDFQCFWSMGLMPVPSLRPDQCGLILHIMTGSIFASALLVATNVHPGQVLSDEATSLLEHLAEKQLILVIDGNVTRKLIGPPADLKRVFGVMREKFPSLGSVKVRTVPGESNHQE